MQDTQQVEFKPPKGFIPPQANETGEFDLVCTFRSKPGGTICLTQLGDTKMPGYGQSQTEKVESKPDYSQYSQGIAQAMPQPGA